MTMRVLITGGFGYIGGRVAQKLADAGFSVFLGTRRTGLIAPPWLPQAQVSHLDWNSATALAEACARMDCVIHLAAMNEVESARSPVEALRMNGLVSLQMLEAAIAAEVPRFIYFSTAHIYGSPLVGVIDETTLPRPQHPYAITHKVAEDFVLAAHDKKRIEGVVLRLSNGFGVPATAEVDRWTLIVNDLCRQAVENGELRMQTPGTQLRDFITLEDVARALVHVLRLNAAALADGLFNLGGDYSVPVVSMAEKIIARWKVLTGQELLFYRPTAHESSPQTLVYSCEKFKRTGFNLTSDITGEIDATLLLCQTAFGSKA